MRSLAEMLYPRQEKEAEERVVKGTPHVVMEQGEQKRNEAEGEVEVVVLMEKFNSKKISLC